MIEKKKCDATGPCDAQADHRIRNGKFISSYLGTDKVCPFCNTRIASLTDPMNASMSQAELVGKILKRFG